MVSGHRQKRSIAVIGAGPAGLMAAEVIATAGHRVTVYERMPSPARKFLMAGRGGLNLTHSEPLDTFLGRYGGDSVAVRQAVSAFPPERLIAWANGLGQETFAGSSGRIFPKTMKASPLLRAWLRRLATLNVVLKTGHTWTGFADGGGLIISGRDGHVEIVEPDACVFALGGASWPRLGSDGAWVQTLTRENISVAPLTPANCGVQVAWSEHVVPRFSGTPLKRISVSTGGMMRRGEAVLTSMGLEGGAIYALGPALRAALERDGTAKLYIDFKPDMMVTDLAERLSKPQGSQSRTNFLRKALSLEPVAFAILRECGPLPVASSDLAALIKAVPVTALGLTGLERAISSAGGVRFDGLTAGLMAKDRPGLFFAGEMLNWEAPTGGYLLQGTFATGVRAGEAVNDWLESVKR